MICYIKIYYIYINASSRKQGTSGGEQPPLDVIESISVGDMGID